MPMPMSMQLPTPMPMPMPPQTDDYSELGPDAYTDAYPDAYTPTTDVYAEPALTSLAPNTPALTCCCELGYEEICQYCDTAPLEYLARHQRTPPTQQIQEVPHYLAAAPYLAVYPEEDACRDAAPQQQSMMPPSIPMPSSTPMPSPTTAIPTAAQTRKQLSTARCPFCIFVASNCGSRPVASAMRDHLNTMHREKLHPTTDLSMVGCIICSTCREAVPGSPQAMSQHQCGAFVTKAQKVASALRDAVLINHHTSSQNKSSDDPSTNATTSKKSFWGKPSVDVKQYSDLISEAQTQQKQPQHPPQEQPRHLRAENMRNESTSTHSMDVGSRDLLQWVNDTPSTHRFIKKKEWDNLRSMFLGAMSGYNHTTNDEPGLYQREQQELLVSNLVRCNLRHKQPNGGAHEKSQQDDDMQRLAKKTMIQLQLGAIGKATRTLAAPPTSIVPPTADLIERLRDLFPMEQPLQRPQRAQYCVMRLDSSLVKDIVLKRMSRAAAPGPDGWTRELLVPIVKDKECLSQLTGIWCVE